MADFLLIAIPAYLQRQVLTKISLEVKGNVECKNLEIMFPCFFAPLCSFGHCNTGYTFAGLTLNMCLWPNFKDSLLFGN